ncbi:MAG: hypothetical protein P9X24_07590 [Candidatus Hatepunaea meridiana]|nr:hypothetical protein [Candidatus Hatepunaea meridiana]
MKNISEKRIADVLICHLRQNASVVRELKHYENRIDIVSMDPATNEINTYEAKISNWTKALSQAIVNLTAGEKAYIAIYDKFIHRVQKERLIEYGIGLLSVGSSWGQVSIIMEAQQSPFVNHQMTEWVRQNYFGFNKG